MIIIKDLKKSYGKKQVLLGVDIQIDKAGIYAVLGPNGSGKTTIMKCVLGMVIPNSGLIEIDGKTIKKNIQYRKGIDYVPQIANFPNNIKVDEMFDLIERIRGEEPKRREELIHLFKLESHLKSRIGALSGGTLQKLNLSIALMFDSPLLILDEPTSGLDPIALIALKKLLIEERAKGKIILLTTHIMNLVEELADEVTFLLEGKIYFSGPIQELRHQHGDRNMENVMAEILQDHV